jgi:hypothetical protein
LVSAAKAVPQANRPAKARAISVFIGVILLE